MHPPPPHLQITLEKKGWKKEREKGKEMCNLFRACLYVEEDIINQNR